MGAGRDGGVARRTVKASALSFFTATATLPHALQATYTSLPLVHLPLNSQPTHRCCAASCWTRAASCAWKSVASGPAS